MDNRLRKNLAIGPLMRLYEDTTAQVRGQIMQQLLGYALEIGGHDVVQNAVGVPDMVATHHESGRLFAIEAKTGDPVVLGERDLDGVRRPGGHGVVAAFIFPDTNPRWCLTDAQHLQPGRWQWWQLERKPALDFGFAVQRVFLDLLIQVPGTVLLDRERLGDWGDRQRGSGWSAFSAPC